VCRGIIRGGCGAAARSAVMPAGDAGIRTAEELEDAVITGFPRALSRLLLQHLFRLLPLDVLLVRLGRSRHNLEQLTDGDRIIGILLRRNRFNFNLIYAIEALGLSQLRLDHKFDNSLLFR
jgi:hypothetical protein